MSTVTVVIPNWNGKKWLKPCLESLAKQTFQDFDIIVVENGSTDGSAGYLQQYWPAVRVLSQTKNLGFAGGVNVGIKAANTPYVALFNNDAAAAPDWLAQLVKRIDASNSIGAVTSKILKSTPRGDEFDSTGDFYYTWGRANPRDRGILDEGQREVAEEVFGASGGATLYRTDLFKSIGLFDEEFFAYYEDVDLSFRARLAGWSIWYEPRAVVYHEIGGTSGGGATAFSRYHSAKNLWYLYLKNMPSRLFWRYLFRFNFLQVLFYGNSFLTHLSWAHTKGIMRALIMTPAMLIKRWGIQRKATLSSGEVDHLLLHEIPPGMGPNFYRYFGWIARKDKS